MTEGQRNIINAHVILKMLRAHNMAEEIERLRGVAAKFEKAEHAKNCGIDDGRGCDCGLFDAISETSQIERGNDGKV